MRLVLTLCRFVCQQPSCPRKTFAEPIPALAQRSARRTTRLTAVVERLGLALGGEPASRLADVLGMPCSPDTILRVLRRLPDEPIGRPRVVSLDDWAWRRGHRYGTILCDLERHRRLEVLPDREVAPVAAWLARYPSIEVVSRDRSDAYATAATLGAPQAIQVADKWHLLHNLSEAIQPWLAHQLTEQQKRQRVLPAPADSELLPNRRPRRTNQQESRRQEHRAVRLDRYEQVTTLRQRGMSYQAIADVVGVGHSTVQRWLQAGTFPERHRREQSSQLDPFLPFIRECWAQGCHTMARLHRELRARGYHGAYESVRNLVRGLQQGERHAPLPQYSLPSARQVTGWFLRRPEDLTDDEQRHLDQGCQLHPEIALAYDLVQQFARMLRHRTGADLDAWMDRVRASRLVVLYPFVAGIAQDKAAVQAGLTLEWSQGQTEGQITRLKLIKRQGYGRAKFDLLRRRVLHAA